MRIGGAGALAALWALASPAAFGQAPPAELSLDHRELDGAIAGRVCADLDGDGRCSDSEPGFAGLRLVLETGLQAKTDEKGRYHLAAVPARTPDALGGGRLLPGRHRLKLDDRALPSGTHARPASVTVEVPMGALVRQDFALSQGSQAATDLATAHGAQPPTTRIEKGRVRFLVAGQASPGDRVTVQGQRAEVDGAGAYRASLELPAGSTDLSITALSPAGAVRMFIQRVDVIRRDGGFLVVPRAIEPTASVQLPAGAGEAASTGATSIQLRSLPGTRVRHPGGEAVVGADGVAQIPLDLRSGENSVPLRIERPGQPVREDLLAIPAAPRPFAVGLLDLEGTFEPRRGDLRLFGRGAAHAQHRIAGFELSAELELRDQDIPDVKNNDAWALLAPRRPDSLERALDPEEYPIEWADDSITTAPNPAEGRFRVEARSDTLGALGYGTHRAAFADVEVGRYQRELFGAYLDLHTPAKASAQGGVRAFYDPGRGDPTRELGLLPAHEELRATGGSLYYLGSPFISQGSEVVRVELRDGLTGLPVRERHLSRGEDYEIDYRSGRILLARPLSFSAGAGPLPAEPLTSGAEPVLVVDYERVLLAGAGNGAAVEGRRVAGGELRGSVGPVKASVGLVDEKGAQTFMRLWRGQASAPLGPVTLFAEAALSRGVGIASDGFGISDDGGLSFARPAPGAANGGEALGVRLRGPGLSKDGYVDAAFRWRTRGFFDGSHQDVAGMRQLSLRADQPLGNFRVGLLADDLEGADPRDPFGPRTVSSRTLGASVGWQRPDYGLSLEGRDSELSAPEEALGEPLTGGRTSVGAAGRYRLSERLTLLAAHKQVVARRGEGPGAFDDSFTSGGVDLKLVEQATVGLMGGWGPRLGPQVWGQADVKSGRDTWYGGYSVDVDAPHLGERRT
ncbi:MAG: flagellar motor protein, partial [Myxococcaceae bacterium]